MAKRKINEEEEDDGDWVPSANGEDDDDDDEYMAAVIDGDELAPGDYEVEDEDGKVTVMRGAVDKDTVTDEDILKLAAADERFQQHTKKRKIRFNGIFDIAKESSNVRYQNVLVCSDSWKGMKNVPKGQSQVIECKVGNLIQYGTTTNGTPKLRQITTEEATKMDVTDSNPCECRTCTKRRENSTAIASATGLRSGKKRGWDKYGPGRTL